MNRLLILSMIVSVSAMAAPIGTCTPGALSTFIGNSCTLGDKTFDNFTYSGNVLAANIGVDFQVKDTEFRLILAPMTGFGFFTAFDFSSSITVNAGVAPNIAPAVYRIVGVKDQSNFSLAQGSTGLLHVVNSPGPTYDLVPGNETGGPTFFAPTTSVVTTAKLSGPGGTGSANPGLSSFELGYIQANTAVPEPATFGLIGLAFVCAGLARKRAVRT